jgi:hypothetical protein
MRIGVLNRLTQALLATSLLLMLTIALQLSFPAAPSVDDSVSLPEDEASLPDFGSAALSPPMLADLNEMLDRPLFFSSRRMPEPPKEETPPPPPPKPIRLKLIGVALADGSRVALLRNLVNNQLVHLAEGETHDGWSLDTVGAQSASFSRGPQVAELPLELEGQAPRRR